jgi:hypothetical protein
VGGSVSTVAVKPASLSAVATVAALVNTPPSSAVAAFASLNAVVSAAFASVSCALERYFRNAGTAIATSRPMMMMTMRSSISVKPELERRRCERGWRMNMTGVLPSRGV